MMISILWMINGGSEIKFDRVKVDVDKIESEKKNI